MHKTTLVSTLFNCDVEHASNGRLCQSAQVPHHSHNTLASQKFPRTLCFDPCSEFTVFQYMAVRRIDCVKQCSACQAGKSKQNPILGEEMVTVGARFVAWVTYTWGKHQMCSTTVFSFASCIMDGTQVCSTIKEALAWPHAVIFLQQFLPLELGAKGGGGDFLRGACWFGP